MRTRGTACGLLAAAVVATAAGAAGAAPPTRLTEKQAEARHVIAEIDAIDRRLGVVTEQFDGARVHLQQAQARLRTEQLALVRARADDRRAKDRVAALVVALYVGDRPSTLDVLVGVHSVSDLLRLSDAERALDEQVRSVAADARAAKQRVQRQVEAVRADRAAAAQTVRRLSSARTQIVRGLAQRQLLLASVQAQISRIEAQQRARQARLAAEARARLAAELAARARAAAEAAAARARAAQTARAAARTRQAASTPAAAPAAPVAPAVTTPSPAPTPAPAPPDPGAAALGLGHPQAAQIALQYIGVPYLWGGATPSGFDCSGLVTYVFAQLGVTLPHYAADQYTYGTAVPLGQLQPGDLVFFDSLNHVGIYIGGGQYVDAPDTGSFVRIESLTDAWATATYYGARRV